MSETSFRAGAPQCPITMCRVGERATISRISGREETRRFLAGLGFLAGGRVSVVSRSGDSFILDVKGSKIAIDGSMASRIVVNPERILDEDPREGFHRHHGQGREDPRRGRHQAPHHGHGHHQGLPDLRQEGGPAGRPHRDNRQGLRAHPQEVRGGQHRGREPPRRRPRWL